MATVILNHLETNLTGACQLRCVGCNHFTPLQSKWFADPEQIAGDLRELGKVAHVYRYALIGGEPLLHKDIDTILQIAINSGIADIVEVWTNGILLPKMSDVFWKYAKHITLTRYPDKIDNEGMEVIQSLCRDNGVKLVIKDPAVDFIELLHPDLASDQEAERLYRECWYRHNTHVLDGGYLYRCCVSPYIPGLIMNKKRETDGIAVKGIAGDAIRAYLNQSKTPQSCYRCAGHGARHIGWRETTRAKWLEESTSKGRSA